MATSQHGANWEHKGKCLLNFLPLICQSPKVITCLFLKAWDILGVICEDIGVLMATCLNDKTAARSPVSLMGIWEWI